ncbi:MAG: hypothetical protein K5829_15365 [Treponema sp.]|nr:hypothetical protein [Treponema sp.]
MTTNVLYQQLFNLYGPVTRARNSFLYTKKGVRITDLFQENGRAILGWEGANAFTMLKNTLSRGQTGNFICEENNRLDKAVSELLESPRKVFYFSNKIDAMKAGLALAPESTNVYKPWNKVAFEWKDLSSVIIEPPLPWTDSIFLLAVKSEEALLPLSKITIPFALQVALSRAIYNLIAELKNRSEEDWFIYDPVLTKYWTRRGPYLYPKIPQEDYDNFVLHCLSLGILINPDYNSPSIVPYGADRGIFSKLKKTAFTGGKNES